MHVNYLKPYLLTLFCFVKIFLMPNTEYRGVFINWNIYITFAPNIKLYVKFRGNQVRMLLWEKVSLNVKVNFSQLAVWLIYYVNLNKICGHRIIELRYLTKEKKLTCIQLNIPRKEACFLLEINFITRLETAMWKDQ